MFAVGLVVVEVVDAARTDSAVGTVGSIAEIVGFEHARIADGELG